MNYCQFLNLLRQHLYGYGYRLDDFSTFELEDLYNYYEFELDNPELSISNFCYYLIFNHK